MDTFLPRGSLDIPEPSSQRFDSDVDAVKAKGLHKYSQEFGGEPRDVARKAAKAFDRASVDIKRSVEQMQRHPIAFDVAATSLEAVQKEVLGRKESLEGLKEKLHTLKETLCKATGSLSRDDFITKSKTYSELEMAVRALETELNTYDEISQHSEVQYACSAAQNACQRLSFLSRHECSFVEYDACLSQIKEAQVQLNQIVHDFPDGHPLHALAENALSLIKNVVKQALGQVATQSPSFKQRMSSLCHPFDKPRQERERSLFESQRGALVAELKAIRAELQSVPSRPSLRTHTGRAQYRENIQSVRDRISLLEGDLRDLQREIAHATPGAPRRNLLERLEQLQHKLGEALTSLKEMENVLGKHETGSSFVERAVIQTAIDAMKAQVEDLKDIIQLPNFEKFSESSQHCEELIGKALHPKTKEPERSLLLYQACCELEQIEGFVDAWEESPAAAREFVASNVKLLGAQLNNAIHLDSSEEISAVQSFLRGEVLSPLEKGHVLAFVTKNITASLFGTIDPTKQWVLELCIQMLGSVDDNHGVMDAINTFKARVPRESELALSGLTREKGVRDSATLLSDLQSLVGTNPWTVSDAQKFRRLEQNLETLKGSLPFESFAALKGCVDAIVQRVLPDFSKRELTLFEDLKQGRTKEAIQGNFLYRLVLIAAYHPVESVKERAMSMLDSLPSDQFPSTAGLRASLRVEVESKEEGRALGIVTGLQVLAGSHSWSDADISLFSELIADYDAIRDQLPDETVAQIEQCIQQIVLLSGNLDMRANILTSLAIHHPDERVRSKAKELLRPIFNDEQCRSLRAIQNPLFVSLMVENFSEDQLSTVSLTAEDRDQFVAALRGDHPTFESPKDLAAYCDRIYLTSAQLDKLMLRGESDVFNCFSTVAKADLTAYVPQTRLVAQDPGVQEILREQQSLVEEMRMTDDVGRLIQLKTRYDKTTKEFSQKIATVFPITPNLWGLQDDLRNSIDTYSGIPRAADEAEVLASVQQKILNSPAVKEAVARGKAYVDDAILSLKEMGPEEAEHRLWSDEFQVGLKAAFRLDFPDGILSLVKQQVFDQYPEIPPGMGAVDLCLAGPEEFIKQCVDYRLSQLIFYSGVGVNKLFEPLMLASTDPGRVITLLAGDIRATRERADGLESEELKEKERKLEELKRHQADLQAATDNFLVWRPLFDRFDMRPVATASPDELAMKFRGGLEGTFKFAITQMTTIASLLKDRESLPPEVVKQLEEAGQALLEYVEKVIPMFPELIQLQIRDRMSNKASSYMDLFSQEKSLGGADGATKATILLEFFAIRLVRYIIRLSKAKDAFPQETEELPRRLMPADAERKPAADSKTSTQVAQMTVRTMLANLQSPVFNALSLMSQGCFDRDTRWRIFKTIQTTKNIQI